MGKSPESLGADHVTYLVQHHVGWRMHCVEFPDIKADCFQSVDRVAAELHDRVCQRLGKEVDALVEVVSPPNYRYREHLALQRSAPKRTRASLVQQLDELDLRHFESEVLADVRPTVLFRSVLCEDDTQLPVGTTRLGGDPDLPTSADWPTTRGEPLTLLLQLRLSDLPAQDYVDYTGDTSLMLPARGMLWFWYHEHSDTWETRYGEPDGAFRVTFHPDETTPLTRYETPKGTVKLQAATAPLWSAPSLRYPETCSGPELHRFFDFFELVERTSGDRCRLRGHHNAFYTDQDEGRPDDAELLCELATDETVPGWQWGDGGGMYFWIRRSDLEKGDFSRVWGTIESG
ncbi:MAG: DUF1963 domain-containing protein [Phycisphaerales bacterium]|nr:DUF1963 domain-containing protein [Phycisphaerales bacterium]